MENHFYSVIPKELRDFYNETNLELFRKAQPDVYEANVRLAEVLDLPIQQTVTVNSITEFSTYCTSILARSKSGQITHVRNLDFGYTEVMKKLIYTANLTKDGEVRGQSPCIAGFYGSYTGHKQGQFSASYNVRETVNVPSVEMLRQNL
jgi:hypothetical protein